MSPSPRARWLVAGLLVAVFATRAIALDQPILENYVGRQVPTAMVARNLAQGSGFFHPQLDTGPFPNLFLVEPPVQDQLVAWLSVGTGLPLDPAGRLVSALATTLAAWGLFGLVRRRQGIATACASVIVFAAFPVTIRYGRAFQPDALAMGLIVAGIRCWDDSRALISGLVVDQDRGGGSMGATAAHRFGLGRPLGWLLLAIGLAQKVNWAFVLVPLVWVILKDAPRARKFVATFTLVPAALWYLLVMTNLEQPIGGSTANGDNLRNWAERLGPASFFEGRRYVMIARDLIWRAFTPFGSCLAIVGVIGWKSVDRLWTVWTLAAAATLLLLFGKLHHDYYWMILAPPAAAWAGIALIRLMEKSRLMAGVALGAVVVMGMVQTRSTWETPSEWRGAVGLARSIREHVGRGDLVIAPEAVLYLGERRGCRLEYDASAARRAANEWRPSPAYREEDPTALISFYRHQAGARYFADVEPDPDDPSRRRLHDFVRNAPSARIIDDQPGNYLLVEFDDPPRR